jgi:hypothetical protein
VLRRVARPGRDQGSRPLSVPARYAAFSSALRWLTWARVGPCFSPPLLKGRVRLKKVRAHYQDERLAKFLCGRLVVIYPVTDIRRARTFYEQTLGLKVGNHRNRGDKWWIEYDLPAARGSSSSKAERLAAPKDQGGGEQNGL